MKFGTFFVPLLIAVALSSCGVYVGNVKFATVEVCSQELASRLTQTKGCLPPTRVDNVQSFYLERYRLPISNVEAASLVANSQPQIQKNLLPSLLGRGFNVRSSGGSSESVTWIVPETGGIEFLPTGDFDAPPELNIDTEVLYKTDLTGIVQKKIEAGMELNPSQIVDAALKISGAPPLPGLSSALSDKLIKSGFTRQSINLGKGGYYYVSMLPSTLDSLTYALSLCRWRIGSSFSGRQLTTSKATCEDTMRNLSNVAPSIKTLLSSLEKASQSGNGSNFIGIVVGVAVVRTERGMSDLCSRSDIRLVASGANSSLSMATCEELRIALRDFKVEGSVVPSNGKSTEQQATMLTEPQKQNILIALNAEMAKAVYKTLDIGDHSSVLAIHWIPAKIPSAENVKVEKEIVTKAIGEGS